MTAEQRALRARRLRDPLGEPEVKALIAAFGPNFDRTVLWSWWWSEWGIRAIRAWERFADTGPDTSAWFEAGALYLLTLADGMNARARERTGKLPFRRGDKKPKGLAWAKAIFIVRYLRRLGPLPAVPGLRDPLPDGFERWSERQAAAALEALKLSPSAVKEAIRRAPRASGPRVVRPSDAFLSRGPAGALTRIIGEALDSQDPPGRPDPFAVPFAWPSGPFFHELAELLGFLHNTHPGYPFMDRVLQWFAPRNFPHAREGPGSPLHELRELAEKWAELHAPRR